MQVAESEVKHAGEVNTIVNLDIKNLGVISDSRALFTMQGGSELKSSAWKELIKKAQPDPTCNHQK